MQTWEEKQILFYNCVLLISGLIILQVQVYSFVHFGKITGGFLIVLSLINILALFIPKSQSNFKKNSTLSPRKLERKTKKTTTLDLTKSLKKSILSPKKKEGITQESLDSLLRKEIKSQELKKVVLTDNLQKFQPAAQYQIPVKVERIEDGFLFKNTSATMEEFHSIAPLLDDWCEGIRKWMENKIVSPLVKRMKAVDEAFESAGLGYLDCKSMTLDSRSDPLVSRNFLKFIVRKWADIFKF